MPVRRQLIDIPLAGLDESSPDIALSHPHLLEAKNVRYEKRGKLVAIAKRYGFDIKTNTNTVGTAGTIFEHDGQIVKLGPGDGDDADSGLPQTHALDGNGWRTPTREDGEQPVPWIPTSVKTGELVRAEPGDTTKYEGGSVTSQPTIDMYDYTVSGDLDLAALVYFDFQDSQAYAIVYKLSTDAIVLGPTALASSSVLATGFTVVHYVKIIPTSTGFLMVGNDGTGTGNVYYAWYYTASTNTWSARQTVKTVSATVSPDYYFDLVVGDGTNADVVMVVADHNGANDTIRIMTLTEQGAVVAEDTFTGTADKSLACLAISGGTVMIGAGSAGGNPTAWVADISGALPWSITGPTTIATAALGDARAMSIAQHESDFLYSWYEVAPGGTDVNRGRTRAQKISTSATKIGNLVEVPLMVPIAKSYTDNNRAHIPCTYDPVGGQSSTSGISLANGETVQPMGLVITPFNLGGTSGEGGFAAVARFGKDLISPTRTSLIYVPASSAIHDTTKARFAWGIPESFSGAAAGALKALAYADVDMDPPPLPTVRMGRNTYMGGGVVGSWDGHYTEEQVVPFAPEPPRVTAQGTGGSLPDGAFLVAAHFEWEDSNGVIHRTAPAFSESVTVGPASGNGSIIASTTTCPITARSWAGDAEDYRRMSVVWHLTEANGSNYFRHVETIVDLSDKSGVIDHTFTDVPSSAAAASYFTGGVVVPDSPPPARHLVASSDRLWIINADNPREVWYSKLVRDLIAPEFSSSFVARVADDDIVGIAVMDEKAVLFGEHNIYAIFGDGPNDLGQQDTFSTPTIVAAGVSCTSAGSISRVPQGIVFQSRDGIQLLGRDLTVTNIGRPVEDTLGTSTITRAVLIEADKSIRFIMDGSATILVFWYELGAWSTFTVPVGVIDACVHNGLMVWTTFLEKLYVENRSRKDDADHSDGLPSHVEMAITTPWIRPAGLHQQYKFRRMLVTGVKNEDHQLRIQAYYDDDDSSSDTTTKTSDDVSALSPYRYEYRFHRQRLDSVKIRIRDGGLLSGDPSDGFEILHMTLDVGVRETGVTLGTSRRF